MKIVYFGNADFGIPTLDKLLTSSDNKLTHVITNPNRKSGRGQKEKETPIKSWAIKNNIEVIQADDINNSHFIESLKHLKADLFIVIAYRILPPKVFTIPKYGTINLHASLLPKYRGAAPIQRAIMNNEKKTGITTFKINEKIDTGEIVKQKSIEINKNDNYNTLYKKLSKLGSTLILDSIVHIKERKPLLQQHGKGSYANKINKKDLQINWNHSRRAILNQIRALSPYPGVYSYLNDKRVKILSAKGTKRVTSKAIPGKVNIIKNLLYVYTSDQLIEITSLQIEGKKNMNAGDFINGYVNDIDNSLHFEYKV